MAKVNFEVDTDLSPAAALSALTDFGPQRAQTFGNISSGHFALHGQGIGWADATEGNWLAWERSRYEWGAATEPLTVTTIESNTWKAGSRWQYGFAARPGGGTRVTVDVIRMGRGVRGVLLGPVIAILGSRILRADLRNALKAAGGPMPGHSR